MTVIKKKKLEQVFGFVGWESLHTSSYGRDSITSFECHHCKYTAPCCIVGQKVKMNSKRQAEEVPRVMRHRQLKANSNRAKYPTKTSASLLSCGKIMVPQRHCVSHTRVNAKAGWRIGNGKHVAYYIECCQLAFRHIHTCIKTPCFKVHSSK